MLLVVWGHELYCLTAGRLLLVWSLHVFLVFIQVSWVADVLISVHCLETLHCCTSAFICVRVSPVKSSSLPSTHRSMESQMNECTRLWVIRLTPTGIFKCSPSVWWSRKCEAIASSIFHQAGCRVSFHLLPVKYVMFHHLSPQILI